MEHVRHLVIRVVFGSCLATQKDLIQLPLCYSALTRAILNTTNLVPGLVPTHGHEAGMLGHLLVGISSISGQCPGLVWMIEL